MFFSGYQCDNCGKIVTFNRYPKAPPSMEMLVKDAREAGWSAGSEEILCQHCRKTKSRLSSPIGEGEYIAKITGCDQVTVKERVENLIKL